LAKWIEIGSDEFNEQAFIDRLADFINNKIPGEAKHPSTLDVLFGERMDARKFLAMTRVRTYYPNFNLLLKVITHVLY